MRFPKLLSSLSVLFACAPVLSQAEPLTLDQALEVALKRDPQLRQTLASEKALQYSAVADAQLPDPSVRLGMMNLPTDTWDTDQENMTQLQLGITQMLPRGDSLRLKSERTRLQAQAQAYQYQVRVAEVQRDVSQLWLDAIRVQRQQALLNEGIAHLKPLVSAAKARYQAGISREQDQADALLTLSRLQDRQQQLAERYAQIKGRLTGWLGYPAVQQGLQTDWPQLTQPAVQELADHPQLQMLSQAVEAARKGSELAQQAYKPALGVSLSYGYREDMPSGRERADMASFGVTMDLPLFTEKRQDQRFNAAQEQISVAAEKRQQAYNRLQGQWYGDQARFDQLEQRLAFYDQTYLPQLKRKVRAANDAYGRDQASIAELTQAELAYVMGRLERAGLVSQRLQTLASLNYLAAQSQPLTPAQAQGGDYE